MSTFEVKIRQIDVLEAHPNADRLELVVIGGYKAVVQKGIHKIGDKIVYIPEDTVFKNLSVAERLGIAPYLTGKQKNRVKAIRLRGVLSQGIVLPRFAFAGDCFVGPFMDDVEMPAEYLVEMLEVEKYEEPIPIEMSGQVRSWPSFVSHYDVENIKRPESMAEMREGEPVIATEKLHGTNIAIAWGPGLDDGEDVFVCSRGRALKESETNVYWRAVRQELLIEKLHNIIVAYEDRIGPVVSISLHGEVIGVQDLKYGYSGGQIGFRAFDIMINGEFVDYDIFCQFCVLNCIPVVPLLFRNAYCYKQLDNLAQGLSAEYREHIREGIVVKPETERRDRFGNRVQYKFISEEYLTRKGGSEHH